MKVLIITGDRNAARYAPERSRWHAAISGVLDETFDGDQLNAAVIVGSNAGIDTLAFELALDVPMLVGRVENERLIFAAKQYRWIGADVSFVVFHDNIFFSRSTRQILEDAKLHGFPAMVVSSRGHVQVKAA